MKQQAPGNDHFAFTALSVCVISRLADKTSVAENYVDKDPWLSTSPPFEARASENRRTVDYGGLRKHIRYLAWERSNKFSPRANDAEIGDGGPQKQLNPRDDREGHSSARSAVSSLCIICFFKASLMKFSLLVCGTRWGKRWGENGNTPLGCSTSAESRRGVC
ncbi:hypothetical protein BaRGS_00037050 [Batillaria attramentaria]|uniref:Uncharacterized protein n=1 Tax=Batillaria attramentaria TaxID=370345 RepID=A0ABD0JA10_9CAEN